MNRPKGAIPKKSFSETDETIASIFGEQVSRNNKIRTTITLQENIHRCVNMIAEDEGITMNAYIVSLIKADARRRGYSV